MDAATANMGLRVQALSRSLHDELVLLALRPRHAAHDTFHEVTARRIYCIGSRCIGRVLGVHASLRDGSDDLIAAGAVAAILGVSPQRVQQLATEGRLLPVVVPGAQSRTLFQRYDVERLRAERGVGRYGRVSR